LIRKDDEGSDGDGPKQILMNLKDLIDLSYSDDDEEQNDRLSLAAIARDVFEHPPSDSQPEIEPLTPAQEEEEEEEEGQAPPASPRPSVFMFGGQELRLPSVGDGDSMEYRVEALRQFIERGLGLDKFIEAYQIVIAEGDDSNVDAELKRVLETAEQRAYVPLIQQLVVCEESLGDEA
jgi:hypothetical protein